jgi:hypothetical protein
MLLGGKMFNIPDFPYSDANQLNLDWILGQIKTMTNWINDKASEEIQNFINQKFNDIMMDATYKPETETLVLSLKNNGGV